MLATDEHGKRQPDRTAAEFGELVQLYSVIEANLSGESLGLNMIQVRTCVGSESCSDAHRG